MAGNVFNLPLYIPAIDVQYLSGTGNNNLSFQDIDIQSDTLTSGQSVDLNAIGTQTTANLLYVLPGNFTIDQGATLAVGANVPVLIGPAPYGATQTLTDNGTLTFAAGDTVTLNASAGYSTTQIVVGNGGLLTPQRHHLQRHAGGTTQIVVNSGGETPGQQQHLRSQRTQPEHRRPSSTRATWSATPSTCLCISRPLTYNISPVLAMTTCSFQVIYIQPDTLTNGQTSP